VHLSETAYRVRACKMYATLNAYIRNSIQTCARQAPSRACRLEASVMICKEPLSWVRRLDMQLRCERDSANRFPLVHQVIRSGIFPLPPPTEVLQSHTAPRTGESRGTHTHTHTTRYGVSVTTRYWFFTLLVAGFQPPAAGFQPLPFQNNRW
jgi:hypothetical protein